MRPHPRAACFGLKMSVTSLPWRLFLLNLQALCIFLLCLFMSRVLFGFYRTSGSSHDMRLGCVTIKEAVSNPTTDQWLWQHLRCFRDPLLICLGRGFTQGGWTELNWSGNIATDPSLIHCLGRRRAVGTDLGTQTLLDIQFLSFLLHCWITEGCYLFVELWCLCVWWLLI